MPDERTTLKEAIDRYLKSLAPGVWFRKKWGGGIYQHKGDSDYMVCAYGRFGVIEAKHPVTKPPLSEAQVQFQNKISRAGGFTLEVTDVSQVVFLMEALRHAYER